MSTAASQFRAAKREFTICIFLLIAAGVVVLFANRGAFSSMMLFPLIFAVAVSVVALATLLTARRVMWKRRLALAVLVIVVAASAPVIHTRVFTRILEAREQRAMEAIGGTPAPEIPFIRAFGIEDRGATPMTFGDRVTLVNFWATWCSACISEMPALMEFWEEHREDGIDVVGVTRLYDSADDPEAAEAEIESIETFLEELGVHYPMLVGPGDSPAHAAYRVDALPSSVLIDGDGVVVAYGAGVAGAERLMEQAVMLLTQP